MTTGSRAATGVGTVPAVRVTIDPVDRSQTEAIGIPNTHTRDPAGVEPIDRSGAVVDLRDTVWSQGTSVERRVERIRNRIRDDVTVHRADDFSTRGRRDTHLEAEAPSITVDCPRAKTPFALDRVPTGRSLHDLLTIVARERGHTASVDARLAHARRRLQEFDPPSIDIADARQRVAEVGAEIDELREQAATLRGQLTARRALEADRSAIQAKLEKTIRTLSEAETTRVAAKQDLERAQRAARRGRDQRERRLQLEDEIANALREARQELGTTIYPAFRSLIEDLPVAVDAGSQPTDLRGSIVLAELIAIALTDRQAPVIVTATPETDAEESGDPEGAHITPSLANALGYPLIYA